MGKHNKRNTLFQWTWRSHIRTALIPLILLALIFVGVYLLSNALLHDISMQSARHDAEQQLLKQVSSEARLVDAKLQGVAQLTRVLQEQTRQALSNADTASIPPPDQYEFSEQGVYHKSTDDDGLAVFYSAIDGPVGPEQQAQARRLERQLAPLVQQINQINPLVQQTYFNTHDSLNLIYPFFDVVEQYAPRIKIPDHAFYYLADAAHNPQREVVWTDVYIDPAGQGWMTSSIAPVYQGDFLAGVVGLDVTVEAIVHEIENLELPWDGYGMLVNKQGTIMALPPQGESDWNLQELTDHDYQDYITDNNFKPDEFNLLLREDLGDFSEEFARRASGLAQLNLSESSLVAWQTVAETGWKFMVVVPEQQVFAAAQQLSERRSTVVFWLVAGLLLFCLLLIAFIYNRSRSSSQAMSHALAKLDEMVHAIGRQHYQQAEPDFSIIELQQTASGIVRMGQQLGQSNAELSDAKRALEQQSGFLKTLLDTIPVPVFYQNEQHQLVECNHAFETFFGISEKQLTGHTVADFIPMVVLPLERDQVHSELRLSDASGQQRQVMVNVARLCADRDGRQGYVGILFDVSERKYALQQLEFARDRALEASQLKSDFIAAISHEVRTPLNGIIGVSELLQESTLNEEQQQFVTTILESASSLLGIINGLLDMAQFEAGSAELKLSRFEPRKLVYRVIDQVKAQAQDKALKLDIDVDTDLPPRLKGDEGRLQQILLNLLGNAIKFTQKGSVSLAVRVEQHQEQRIILRFTVQDTGIGIAVENYDKLFQPFTQLDASHSRSFGGTGLGLSLCRQLVEHMGGEIGFSSQLGVGSSFHFTVPLALDNAMVEDSEPGEAPVMRRVLVVDDGPVNSMLAKTVLTKAGYHVDVATNGEEALAYGEQHRYDLVLMDIYMPQMNGMEVTRRWRERERADHRHTVIIALTANAIEQDREAFFAAGMDDYLGKPYRPAELRELADKWLKRVQPVSANV